MPVVIVTGSSGGIGRGIALRLADDGFDVVVNDIAPKQADIDAVVAEITAKGKNAIGIAADVSNKEQVQALVSGAVEEFGALNVMVANAGILETTPLLELSVEQWDRSMAINLRGVFLCIQTSALQFIKQGGGGKIIAA
jgi:meso-butanediol dehydrogenase/(S,S)-butanediol dehydrogenase/diacetyl reductase